MSLSDRLAQSIPLHSRLLTPLLTHYGSTMTPLMAFVLQYPDVNHATIDGKPAREVGAGAGGAGQKK